MNERVRRLVFLALTAALAYVVMVVGRIPMILFLKYDPKDVVLAIGGFLFGLVAAVTVSLAVAFLEMVTVSETGPIGMLMNFLSSCVFTGTAALFYKKKHSIKGAAAGLALGVLLTTGVMLLWNYFVTPIYMGYARETVADMLLPVFLPYNLIKYTINACITMLLYKPVVTALRRSGLLSGATGTEQAKGGFHLNIVSVLISALVLVTCVLLVLVLF